MEITELVAAAQRWKATDGEGMTRRELELARAYFAERRNSRQVRRINEVLRARIADLLH